jgi:hypothetical protein
MLLQINCTHFHLLSSLFHFIKFSLSYVLLIFSLRIVQLFVQILTFLQIVNFRIVHFIDVQLLNIFVSIQVALVCIPLLPLILLDIFVNISKGRMNLLNVMYFFHLVNCHIFKMFLVCFQFFLFSFLGTYLMNLGLLDRYLCTNLIPEWPISSCSFFYLFYFVEV